MSDAENKDQSAELDYLSMSDEEIRNMSAPPAGAVQVVDEEEDPEPSAEDGDDDQAGAQGNQDDQDNQDPDDQDPEDKTQDQDTDGEDDDAAAEGAGTATDGKAQSAADAKDKDDEGQEQNPAQDSVKADEKKAESESTIDFKSEYERLLAPFKANGRDIKVNNVDEAITLMQMGANYNKKMAALKPNLKLMKLLEKADLLSEDKISFLIDLNRKDPAAINKLVTDSGIDPMDLSADKASAYKQSTYTVDDREIELDTVLDDIQGTPSYTRTLDIVGTKWDAASKSVIASNPGIMRVINDHVQSGIYDRIQKEIDNDRMFGRLIGVSDIEAYRQVGDRLHAQGAFNAMAQGSSQAKAQQPAAKVVVQPKPKQEDVGALKDKKRAASSTKSAASSAASQDFNPLAMSDEEFSKHVNKQFL
jgi:hypothetical protein